MAVADDGQAERQRRLHVEPRVDGDDALRPRWNVVGAQRGGHRTHFALGEGPARQQARPGEADAGEREGAAGK
ncbi:MAG: hypothetical protein JNL14_03340 [Devosia sp.]|uniref:hypothetical protein n=1 Tax=Devosia sp. TaxID=1871048 RepID=UPI001A4120FB|nr:hypothetical protein [Devosia sp.]MBL8596754.1 hypothetical protein [Devosia sp.]